MYIMNNSRGSKCGENLSNTLKKNDKIDLLKVSPCCCSQQHTPHMPSCDASFDKYIPSDITSRKGGCVCLTKESFKTLSCRGGNGC